MMEIEAGLCVLLQQGLYYHSVSLNLLFRRESNEHCLNLGRSNHAQPTLPQCTFIHTPCMYLQCTGPQWAGRRINVFTSIYKNRIYRINEREGNRNYPKWGFDQGGLNLV